MIFSPLLVSLLVAFLPTTNSLPYDHEQVDFNLNQNQQAQNPLEYWGRWDKPIYEFQPSPDNWRFPFYTIMIDRFANGDPTNDDANGTAYEHDLISNQFRSGGDVKGLMDTLDYLQGMGIKGLYLAGSIHINQPWVASSYSPLDLTLMDHHFGNITVWRQAISEIHRRGMYVVLDNTMSTMGDLIGYDGFLNTSTPFSFREHKAIWKSGRHYIDFYTSDTYLDHCSYPRFWTDRGELVGRNVTDLLVGCLDSDFDQYGDVDAFKDYPEWQKQLSKFGSVQDRLREWRPSVLDKIKRFSCITIAMLDIDGFRIDKSLTITSDAQADWSDYIRQCARDHNKNNFFIPGELVGGNALASIYLGRGKEPQMALQTFEDAVAVTNASDPQSYIRNNTRSALDAAAFHYSIYRSMTRFLGIVGTRAAEADTPDNWIDAWDVIVKTNDLINLNTGKFDPRHMYGVTNQDVFRWPALKNGTEKNLVGLFVTTLVLPGIPILVWGEEQGNYVMDSTAKNYLFGRSPMTSSLAWQMHGCYTVGSDYVSFPLDAALRGCLDDNVSLDHRDPSHPVRNILKRMYELRTIYPVLNDGFLLQRLSNKTYDIYLPGNGDTPTETGMWSVLRSRAGPQDFTGQAKGNQIVWLIYSNENTTIDYTFNCGDSGDALIAPFDAGTKGKNLFAPFEEYTVEKGPLTLADGTASTFGCLSKMTIPGWGFKAIVPIDQWVDASPVITQFSPGHDYRLQSSVAAGQQETITVGISFSKKMDCNSFMDAVHIESNTEDGSVPVVDKKSIVCTPMDGADAQYSGGTPTLWNWSARLNGVSNGIHAIVVSNASTDGLNSSTNSVDRFLLRIGQAGNPMVFLHDSNYSTSLLQKNSDSSLYIAHNAAGATKFRYSSDWNSHFTDWMDYQGGKTNLVPFNWTGTKLQAWDGEHVYVQYWSNLTASSNHFQHGDLRGTSQPRRLPHLFLQGSFNQYCYDTGLPGAMYQNYNGTWLYNLMTEWPTSFQFNEWGMNPDGQPDQTLILGDVDSDSILDRIPPGSFLTNVINITHGPASPYIAWTVSVNDANFKYSLTPTGNRWAQLIVFILLAVVPILTAVGTTYVFMQSFYRIKFNQLGVGTKQTLIPFFAFWKLKNAMTSEKLLVHTPEHRKSDPEPDAIHADAGKYRRSVLLATMEYDIEDWAIKIKLGGLGTMAQLMSKNLGHQDLIWVVPCVDGVDYPIDQPAESMFVTILDKEYEIQVQYHVLRNITYVLLDAPVFRKQSKNEPYPARMDDLESAICYSAWNQCIARAMQRFEVGLYHMNDYHGALGPLHLLPKVVPCCLSLHNAEFQGVWPMRNPKERDEVCKVFNIDLTIAEKYVQFGELFNLLHAGASYLRIHQKGFGVVGVSKKYGKRAFARYPIFWGLSKIGSLPNPDHTDTAEWEREDLLSGGEVTIKESFEENRSALKHQAQLWAGLDDKPDAELFVFVGRWSMQKGIDLIADVFPSILEQYSNVQLLCIGPVIDLYGRFAALKLEKMMSLYPGRVYSKPEFTALPPYIFSGSEFVLIPSRDEPFGLVAIEFGRKGALGVGARVGGLGQMPGWWYGIESMTPKHLVGQFKSAIHEALASSQKIRSLMRARAALQRFPVAQWVEDLDTLQSTAMKISEEENLDRISKSPSMTSLKTLFTVGHSTDSIPGVPQIPTQHMSNLNVPGICGSLSGSRTPSAIYSVSSLGLSAQVDDISIPLSINLDLSRDNIQTQQFSTLSYDSVVGERTDFALQKVDPSFTDPHGIHLKAFEKKLEQLSGKSSENVLCIEENLMKSERLFFNSYRDAKMGYSTPNSRALFDLGFPSSFYRPRTPACPSTEHHSYRSVRSNGRKELLSEEFSLGDDYVPPTGLKRVMLYRIGDWPVYTILLAFGQIAAANSYQITLLIGEVGETAEQLYIVATIYAFSSIMWWTFFRRLKSVFILALPFALYGLAFFLIGMAPITQSTTRGWIQKVATGFYAVASSSGSLFFALNFGDEGGAPVKAWVWRACLIQGTQQLYVSGLSYWSTSLIKLSNTGVAVATGVLPNRVITSVTILIAVFMWSAGLFLAAGLPSYYRQIPGKVPSFYKSIYRRKIILWFFVSVVIQNYWLSAPYRRNWRYLWTTVHAPSWAILLLVLVLLVGIWLISLLIFSRLSQSHSWILPVFAIGLGAPRWCQMLWGTSAVGAYLPWAGSPGVGALLGRSLWLWLGVLDALQGVGFGMILLQTMTRFHICFTLMATQVLGSISTILAIATAPDKTGPGDVFPNFALGAGSLVTLPFSLGLLMQIVICVGFALFFRNEQLAKP